jgi:hypothetical protein
MAGTRWGWVATPLLGRFSPGKQLWYPAYRKEAGWAPVAVRTGLEKRKSVASTGVRTENVVYCNIRNHCMTGLFRKKLSYQSTKTTTTPLDRINVYGSLFISCQQNIERNLKCFLKHI